MAEGKSMNKNKLLMGVDLLEGKKEKIKSFGKVSLLCNHSSLDRGLSFSPIALKKKIGDRLISLHSPQHGFFGTEQDNMLETENSSFEPLGIPVYSLYHNKREPDEESLDAIDTLLIDLQIVGCRVYTFKWTILNCLKACKRLNKKVVVLDRPNPLGGETIEGRVLSQEAQSFVGLLPIPMRHGLSVGEFARFANSQIGADLEVIPMTSYDGKAIWSEFDHYWPFTSPNLPNFDSVLFYPGFVLFEGTNVSEGRGTTLPFQMIGAPYIKNPGKLLKRVKDYLPYIEGAYLKETFFKPTFNKWEGQVCGGLQLILREPKKLRSLDLALCILKSILDLHEKDFKWKEPPYEYEFSNLPIHLILGSNQVSKVIKEKSPLDDFWKEGLNDFAKQVSSHLLYERKMS